MSGRILRAPHVSTLGPGSHTWGCLPLLTHWPLPSEGPLRLIGDSSVPNSLMSQEPYCLGVPPPTRK